ncbi:hypothetical protein Tco_0656750 [Tanacetum coccineum]|uniref:Uncharacterized protein n=1 Tax=Tanacetum coccineum TaxID=301880 RepID=A0ABQ4XAW9_9ASTR
MEVTSVVVMESREVNKTIRSVGNIELKWHEVPLAKKVVADYQWWAEEGAVGGGWLELSRVRGDRLDGLVWSGGGRDKRQSVVPPSGRQFLQGHLTSSEVKCEVAELTVFEAHDIIDKSNTSQKARAICDANSLWTLRACGLRLNVPIAYRKRDRGATRLGLKGVGQGGGAGGGGGGLAGAGGGAFTVAGGMGRGRFGHAGASACSRNRKVCVDDVSHEMRTELRHVEGEKRKN